MPTSSLPLTPDRLWQLGVFILAVTFLSLDIHYALFQFLHMKALIQPTGIPLGSDFLSFWSAGHLAAEGRPEAAYDNALLLATHQQAISANLATFAWFYPPTSQMLMMPFGALPYLVALPLYLGLCLSFYLWVLWRFRPKFSTILLALSFQGTWLCLLSGQNGMLSAALLGCGLLLLPHFPLIAGMVWGCFSYKPQLALQLPIALLSGQYSRSLLGGALSGTLLALLSLVFLGWPVWQVFFDTADRPLTLLKAGALPLSHMISTFGALCSLGVSPTLALIAQAIVALLCIVAVHQLWKGAARLHLKGASLIWATLLTNPHIFQYELPLAGLGLLLLWCEAERTGWKKGERLLLVLAWASPPFLPFVYYPSAFLFLLWVTLKRSILPLNDTMRPGLHAG